MGDQKYYNQDGDPVTLYQLVREEPEWAQNRIVEGEKAIAELEQCKISEDFIPPVTCSDCCRLLKTSAKETEELWLALVNIINSEQADTGAEPSVSCYHRALDEGKRLLDSRKATRSFKPSTNWRPSKS